MESNVYVESVSGAVFASAETITYLRYAFLLGLAMFVISSPCYRSRKSWWDAVAANRMIGALRVLIMVELLLNLFLVYCVIQYGSPITIGAFTNLGHGQSWLYGYPRPVIGLALIGCGGLGDMHPYPRLLCVLGLFHQICCDAFSAYQVNQYIYQIQHQSAPTGLYTETLLNIYYYRDLLSFGLCVWILFLNILFIVTVGIWNPPFLTYQTIVGGDFDRCEVMREQRLINHAYQYAVKRSSTGKDKLQASFAQIMSIKNEGNNNNNNATNSVKQNHDMSIV